VAREVEVEHGSAIAGDGTNGEVQEGEFESETGGMVDREKW
jgi:hypothetical protein